MDTFLIIFYGIIFLLLAKLILLKLNKIIMTNEELVAKLDRNTAKVEKIRVEIKALQDAINNNSPVHQSVIDAADRLEATINSADDDNPDAPVPPA